MANDDLQVKIEIEADIKKFLQNLDIIIKKTNRFFTKKAVKEVDVKLNSEDIEKQFEKVKKKVKKEPLHAKVTADTKDAQKTVEDFFKQAEEATEEPKKAKFTADTEDAEKKTEDFSQKAEEASKDRQIELEALTVGALEDLRKFEHKARDTGKKIESDLFVEVRAEYGKAQEALETYKKKFKEGYNEMNEVQREAGRAMIKHLKNVEVEAGRHLNNVTNTGEKTLSRLQVKFDQVTEKMGFSWKRF